MRQIPKPFLAAILAMVLTLSPGFALAAEGAPSSAAVKLDAAQLEQLAAPVALYPDALLAQVLMASTYPLEVVDAARWLRANPGLKGADQDAALQKQNWDASVKSLVKVPQTLQMMNEKLDWTEKLGDAFLAQPKDVMDAVQRLRAKAQAQGNLKSNKQQTVKVEGGGGANTIIIEQAQPDVVYVPAYNPTVVYGPWPYPAYPPYYWYPPGYVAGAAVVSFGVGVAVGYAMWGYPNWHSGDVDINVNRYASFAGHPPPPPPAPPHGGGGRPVPPAPPVPPHGGGNTGTRPGSDIWSHNPDHRGNVPYRNPDVAQRFQRPGHNGLSPAQERVNAREAFRGHSSGFTGDSGASGFPSHMEGRFGHPGQEGGIRPSQEGGMRPGQEGRLGGDGFGRQDRGAAGRDFAGGREFRDSSGGRPSVFSGSGGSGMRHEFQRGAQSRQLMQSHPHGGGFHRFSR